MRAIYTSTGATAALLSEGHIFNLQGEWIGWVDESNQVYSIAGEYVGWLTKDLRVLRKRSIDQMPPRRERPSPRGRIRVPATFPLPPMMAETSFEIVDVFDEMPELLHTTDFDPKAEDLD